MVTWAAGEGRAPTGVAVEEEEEVWTEVLVLAMAARGREEALIPYRQIGFRIFDRYNMF